MLFDTGMQIQHVARLGALEKEQGNPGTKKKKTTIYLGSGQNPKERYRKKVKIAPFRVSIEKYGQSQQNLTAAWLEGAVMQGGEGILSH